jgi:hypothetical protein
MRTQFFLVGLLSGVAGVLVGAGCDNVTAGQTTDTSAPPQLVHAFIQDARYLLAFPNRGSALDILDNNATRQCQIIQASTAKDPQLDTCINEFLVDQVAPDVHCLAAGTCNDPIKIPSSGVPVPLGAPIIGAAPDMRDPGGGIAIRLVFDKVLDNSIETVTMDPTKAPGKTDTYMIAPGLVELDDPAGKAIASTIYLDNGGSPEFSADLELVPLGPAIVIKPKTSLDARSKYTVKILNPGAIKDRQGNAAVGLGGGALPTSLSFTTEDLTPAAAGTFGVSPYDYPDFTADTVEITPNEVVQIAFFEAFLGDSATVTIKSGCTGAKPIAYSDRGADPTMCTMSEPGGYPVLAVVNTDTGVLATAQPVDWPAGDCELTITVPDINGASMFTADYAFTVAGMDETDPMVDPNIASQHVTPAQCQMP